MDPFDVSNSKSMVSKLEKELLVGLVFNPEVTLEATHSLRSWDFGDDVHREIYKTIVNLKKEDKNINLETVVSALLKENLIPQEFNFLEEEEYKKSRDMSLRNAESYVSNIQKYATGRIRRLHGETKRERFPKFTKSAFEEALLVGFAYDIERLQGVFLQTKTFDFYYGNHVVIFEIMLDMMSEHGTLDVDMLLDRLGEECVENSRFKPADYAFLTNSYNAKNREISVDRAQVYLKELRSCAGVRQLSKRAEELRDVACDGHKMTKEEFGALADRAFHDINKTSDVHFQTFNWTGPNVKKVLDTIERNELAPSFISTGFADLDEKIIGLYPGLIVFAGRPQMGASEFAMNLAYNLHVFKTSCE
jgi:replicative DNA helicase